MNYEAAKQYAENIIASRAARARQLKAEYNDGLYEKYPELREIDSRISDIGTEAAKMALSGQPAMQVEAMLDEPFRQRQEYIKKTGIRIKNFCVCKKCKDTGVVRGVYCECYKQLIRRYLANEINRRSPIKLSSFDSFRLDYYSGDPNDCTSPRSMMEKNLAICKAFALREKNCDENLLLMGYAGLGKTHLALSIANERILAGEEVIYCSSANIFRQIEREYTAEFKNDTLLSGLKSCELLILDDLGSEYMTPIVGNAIYDIVNTRYNEHRGTVYTTNITDRGIFDSRYGESVTSRLLGSCRALLFTGEDDIRLLIRKQSDL